MQANKLVVKPWRCDPTKVHVFYPPWEERYDGLYACVIHDYTVDEVRQIINLEGEVSNCSKFRDLCFEMRYNLRKNAKAKIQLGNLGFPVKELADIEVAWLQIKAINHRRLRAEYADNLFTDRVSFDPDELWLELAEWFEKNKGFKREEERC